MRSLVGLLNRLSWFAALLFIAVAGGGLATAVDRPAGDETRPELTSRGDALIRPRLDAMDEELVRTRQALDRLAAAARSVVTALPAGQVEEVGTAVRTGTTLMDDIARARETITTDRAEALEEVRSLPLGNAAGERLARIDAAADALEPVRDAWMRLAEDARVVSALLTALAGHDQAVVDATAAGRNEQWDDALDDLAAAGEHLAAAQRLRDELFRRVPVPTLTSLLQRARAYDDALRRLYDLLDASGGTVTPAVTEARAAVSRAQEALPAEAGVIRVVFAEVSEAGLTPALLIIERARGALASALDAASPDASGAGRTPG